MRRISNVIDNFWGILNWRRFDIGMGLIRRFLMTDDELTMLVALIAAVVLWLGYQVNRWKIRDLEDRVEKLERKDD